VLLHAAPVAAAGRHVPIPVAESVAQYSGDLHITALLQAVPSPAAHCS
jgi:hypothetical protein